MTFFEIVNAYFLEWRARVDADLDAQHIYETSGLDDHALMEFETASARATYHRQRADAIIRYGGALYGQHFWEVRRDLLRLA